MLEKYAQFRTFLPPERSWRTFEMVVFTSSFGGEANPFLSPDLLAMTHIHGPCGILASRAGLFSVANHRHPPRGQSCRGRGHTGLASLGPGPACVGEVARSQIWLTGEGRPAFHPLHLPHPQSWGWVCRKWLQNRASSPLPTKRPPCSCPCKCALEDSLPQEMLL